MVTLFQTVVLVSGHSLGEERCNTPLSSQNYSQTDTSTFMHIVVQNSEKEDFEENVLQFKKVVEEAGLAYTDKGLADPHTPLPRLNTGQY